MFKTQKNIPAYRKSYFIYCNKIKENLNNSFTKKEIHEMNKVVGKINSTKDLKTSDNWESFLQNLKTYWKI